MDILNHLSLLCRRHSTSGRGFPFHILLFFTLNSIFIPRGVTWKWLIPPLTTSSLAVYLVVWCQSPLLLFTTGCYIFLFSLFCFFFFSRFVCMVSWWLVIVLAVSPACVSISLCRFLAVSVVVFWHIAPWVA